MKPSNQMGDGIVMANIVGKIRITRRIVLGAFGAFVITAAVAAGSCYYSVDKKENKTVKKEVVIEAGSEIRIEDFFSDCPIDAKFLTDISGIDTDVPAIYKLTVFYENAFKEDVTLKIEDHKGPEGRPVPRTVYTTWKMPDAKECVENLYDISGIAKVEYKDGTPAFRSEGSYEVPVVITDVYGNNTVIDVPFKVINDRTAPVIEGVRDFEYDADDGEINLLEGITVTDDHDKDPVIRVNDSMVNYRQAGEYEITYSAMDKAGNISTVKSKIIVSIDDEEDGSDDEDDYYYDGSDPYELAAGIMNSLWRSNDVETARAIFDWVHSHVYYQSVSYYQSYEEAAYRGFSRRNGDCYVSYACAKMLLDYAGIPNQMVERYPVYTNGHFWNLVKLNGEWYHCDATIFLDHPDMYFMCTDDEIDDYHHSFDGSLYPERAGGSSEYLPEPEPEPTVTPAPAEVPEITPAPAEPTVTPAPEVTPAEHPETERSFTPEESVAPIAESEPAESSEAVNGNESDITGTVTEPSVQSSESMISEHQE